MIIIKYLAAVLFLGCFLDELEKDIKWLIFKRNQKHRNRNIII